MMLYDIIDETTHVQYAHKWLAALAERAGISHADQEQRAAGIRRQKQTEENQRVERMRQIASGDADPTYQKYRQLLQRLRSQAPLTNAQSCPRRSAKPM
jgi:hypothetical protein